MRAGKFLAGLAAALLFCGAARAQEDLVRYHGCNVRDYGAQATRIWYDTEAFQKAIDDCAKYPHGMVRVPRGEYLIGPITLASNIYLYLDKGAEVIAGTDPALFAHARALITIRDAANVAIGGPGLIDGQGAVWWERIRAVWRDNPAFAVNGAARQGEHDDRPRLVIAQNSHDLRFENVTLQNSPSFHLVLEHTENVLVANMKILAPASAPNTDAIDPVDSRNITITGNTISVGDDVVAIKSNGPDAQHPGAASADITVSGNMILAGRGICIGSGTSGGVRHVRIENNSFDGSLYGVRIKTRRGHGGEVSDILIRNNRMRDVQIPLVFSGYYDYAPLDPKEALRQTDTENGGFFMGNQIWPGISDAPQPYVANATPYIHDVTVDGLVAMGADSVGIAIGLPEKFLSLRLRNVHIQADKGFTIRNADVSAHNVVFEVKNGPAVIAQKAAVYKVGASP